MSALNNKECKIFNYEIKSISQTEVNGVPIGIIKGYLATFQKDRGNDIIDRHAFDRTLKEHKDRNDRSIRMFYQHDPHKIIGDWPLDKLKIDDIGLFGEGHIVLDSNYGKEAYAHTKKGSLSDISISFILRKFQMVPEEDGTVTRQIKDLDLIEASIVSEPMNMGAIVTEVKNYEIKSATPYKDLPLAPENHEWDKDNAETRVRALTKSQDEPSESYKDAFMWYDASEPKNFTSYKLPYADVINGKLHAVPKAIISIAGVLHGARGGVDIPEADKLKVASNVNKYYKKMGMESPLLEKNMTIKNEEDKECLDCELNKEIDIEIDVDDEDEGEYSDEVITRSRLMDEKFTKRDLEKVLRESKRFSKKAGVTLASTLDALRGKSKKSDERVMIIKADIDAIKNLIKKW